MPGVVPNWAGVACIGTIMFSPPPPGIGDGDGVPDGPIDGDVPGADGAGTVGVGLGTLGVSIGGLVDGGFGFGDTFGGVGATGFAGDDGFAVGGAVPGWFDAGGSEFGGFVVGGVGCGFVAIGWFVAGPRYSLGGGTGTVTGVPGSGCGFWVSTVSAPGTGLTGTVLPGEVPDDSGTAGSTGGGGVYAASGAGTLGFDGSDAVDWPSSWPGTVSSPL